MLSMMFLGFYFFAGMCLLVYVVIFLKGLFSVILDATLRASAMERARSTFAATKRMCRPRHILQPVLSVCRLPPTDEEDREVFDLVGSKQLHRLQAFFKVAVHLHAAFIAGFLLMPRSIILGTGPGSDWGAVMTNYVALALVPLFPATLAFWSCPSTLSSSKVDAIYILFVARLCQCSVFMGSASSLMSLSHFSAVVRLAVGVLIGNPWLVGTVSFAYFFSVTWYFPWNADQRGDITWNFFLQFLFREMFTFVAMLLLSVTFQRASYAEARAMLRGKASMDMMNTVQSLLSVLSDAVLKLDSNWQLQEPSRQLSALLLKSEEMPQGASFVALLDAIDNRSFVQQMTYEPIATAESGARPRKPPSCMILHLQDSEESRVRIRLYHTTFSDPKGRLSYLVALREFQDFTEMNDNAMAAIANRSDSGGSLEESEVSEEASFEEEEEEARRAARRARRELVARARQRRAEQIAVETQGRIPARGASASGGAAASAEGRPEEGDGGGLPASSSLHQRLLPDRDDDRDSVASQPMDQNEDYAASFNCQDAGFHIMRATPAFNALMARYGSNKNLSAWVPHTSGFAEFVRAEVNQLPTQMSSPSDALEFGEIKFYPPGRRHEIEYKAQCTLRLHPPQGMGRVIGHIELKNLRFKDKTTRRARERLLGPVTLGRRSDDREPQQSHRSELEKMSL